MLTTTLKKIPVLFPLAKAARDFARRLRSYPRWRALRKKTNVKLDLGSGARRGANGWTTVDVGGADISWDLRHGIPMPDASVDALYSSHLFEHIPYQQLIPFIQECRRVLKPGGSLSVCVPNARFYIDAYVQGRSFRNRQEFYQPAVVDTGSHLDQVNYIAYMGGNHFYLFDEENLTNTLKRGGFQKVEKRSFDPQLDLEVRDFESIYAFARK